MANGKQAKKRRLNMAERAEAMMKLHFPDTADEWLWRRTTNDGFTTVPRTLPIAMQAIDDQTKGQPAGHTLFCLWARTPDHPVITIENPATFAGEAGFTGVRAVDTWRRRMKSLVQLNFIKAKPGTSGDFHYVLVLNPNSAIEQLHRKGKVQPLLYSRFVERVAEIGVMGEIENIREFLDTAGKSNPETKAKRPAPVKKRGGA